MFRRLITETVEYINVLYMTGRSILRKSALAPMSKSCFSWWKATPRIYIQKVDDLVDGRTI